MRSIYLTLGLALVLALGVLVWTLVRHYRESHDTSIS